MLFRKALATSLTCLLLLLTLFPDVQSRRGAGGRWGGAGRTGVGANRGGHPNHRAPHVHTGSSSSGSNAGKMAGAAAAGALGGMVLGHGLSSMARPGYGYGHGGYGGYGHEVGHGYPRHGGHEHGHRHHADRADGVFRNETDMEYYVGASSKGQTSSCALVFGAVVSFYLWIS